MAAITAKLVKELRDKTSAGMMDCKKALNETGGDIEALSVDNTEALREAQIDGKTVTIESGKPEAIVDKMVEGRMVKFFKESVLMTQMFVMDPDRNIETVIADEAKALGADIKMTGYVRMGVGDGIEKKEEDFAAEVAAAVAGS